MSRDRASGHPRHRSRPVVEWPVLDRAAWHQALESGDLLEGDKPAADWAPRSRVKTAWGYGRWLAWLQDRGLLDPKQPPGDRITPESVAAYVRDLLDMNGGFTVFCRAQELCDAIRVMAPGRDWRWLRKIQNALRSRAVSVRNKRARLRPASELVRLGKKLIWKAETATEKPPLTRAVWFRDGLIIALLAHRPLRLSNLAGITLGRHLVGQNCGYCLLFTAEEVKNRRPIEVVVPSSLVPDLDRYLEHHRQVLLTRGGRQEPVRTDTLWVSEVATALAPGSIRQRLRKHTKAAFGQALSPHLFRDCAATTIAVEDPVHARSIMNILGHSTPATAEKHYNQACSLEASRRHQEVLADLRRRLAAKGV